MVQLSKVLAIAAACLAAPAIAHPGEKHDPHHLKREIHARDVMAAAGKRSLGGCESTLHARELTKRNVARRAHTVQKLRQKRGITSGMQSSPFHLPGSIDLDRNRNLTVRSTSKIPS